MNKNIFINFWNYNTKWTHRFVQDPTEDIGDNGGGVFNSLADGDEFVHLFFQMPVWLSGLLPSEVHEDFWVEVVGDVEILAYPYKYWQIVIGDIRMNTI